MRDYKSTISIAELIAKYASGQRDFSYHDFEETDFTNLNLENVNFECSWFHSSTFTNCNLKNVNFNDSNVKCVEFINVNLNASSFIDASVDATTFENCDLRHTNFTNAGWYGHNLSTEEFLEVNKANNKTLTKDNCFIPFTCKNITDLIPEELNDPFGKTTPEICKIAAKELQIFIATHQKNWPHNFGLNSAEKGPSKGKMFGVLIVKKATGELGYLSTFSGKLQAGPHPAIFVPSLFDISSNDNFITKGMNELKVIGNQIKALESRQDTAPDSDIAWLKEQRKQKSIALQQELFDHYHFLNAAGKAKSLCAIFEDYAGKKPPAGAGECAAPKLLQYAFEYQMEPLAIAEFWWGKTTQSQDRKHGNFYPACNDKCRPILGYMLGR